MTAISALWWIVWLSTKASSRPTVVLDHDGGGARAQQHRQAQRPARRTPGKSSSWRPAGGSPPVPRCGALDVGAALATVVVEQRRHRRRRAGLDVVEAVPDVAADAARHHADRLLRVLLVGQRLRARRRLPQDTRPAARRLASAARPARRTRRDEDIRFAQRDSIIRDTPAWVHRTGLDGPSMYERPSRVTPHARRIALEQWCEFSVTGRSVQHRSGQNRHRLIARRGGESR